MTRSGSLPPISGVRDTTRRALQTVAERLGYDLVPQTVYSPVPARALPPGADEPREPAGFRLDVGSQLEFVESQLAPHLAEFGSALDGFDVWNHWYEGHDATLLFAMVRHLRPRRVLEIGSGHSTAVTLRACALNSADGARHERVDASALPRERFLALESGDVLFIDSSHVVKRGSEVNRLVLDVLPRLAPGVAVHFHDVFIPYDYPREWTSAGPTSTSSTCWRRSSRATPATRSCSRSTPSCARAPSA